MSEVDILKLDARGLSHPEPLERSVEILHTLGPDSCFHLIIHRYPQPLLMLAERYGVAFEACEAAENEWHILFAKRGEVDLKNIMKRCCCSV